ncbi:MAG: hypothetical protein KA354_24860 [Phycisphaerae bacterium]|nr:hypothetical protein [Phycisphaerae bacterium]
MIAVYSSLFVRKMLVLGVCLLAVLGGACAPTPPGGRPLPLVTGEELLAGGGTIGSEGGTLTVNDSASPLHGLSINVPPGAYLSPRSFTISYRPILDSSFSTGGEVASPLISIDNGGEYAEEFMTLRIPVSVADDEVAVAFLYDSENGKMEAMTPIDQDDTSITVVTRHFSDAVAKRYNRWELSARPLDSDFAPGADDWPFRNEGSYLEPTGIAGGMCLSELYYYLERRRGRNQPALREAFDSSTLLSGLKTSGFSLDDDEGIWLSSIAVARGIEGVTQTRFLDMIRSDGRKLSLEARQFYATLAALRETGEPQILLVELPEGKGTHVVLCYRWTGPNPSASSLKPRALYVADPNSPGQGKTMIFSPSDSFDQLESTLKFGAVYFCGKTSTNHWSALGKLFTDIENTDLSGPGGGFPVLNYRILELGQDNKETGVSYQLDLNRPSEVEVGRPRAQVMVDVPTGFQKRITAYRYGSPPEKLANSSVLALQEGDNLIGFHVEGFMDPSGLGGILLGGWYWAGFQWINIKYVEEPTPMCTMNDLAGTWRRHYDNDCNGTEDRYDTDDDRLVLHADGTVWSVNFGRREGWGWGVTNNQVSFWYPQGQSIEGWATATSDCGAMINGTTRIFTAGVAWQHYDVCWWASKE